MTKENYYTFKEYVRQFLVRDEVGFNETYETLTTDSNLSQSTQDFVEYLKFRNDIPEIFDGCSFFSIMSLK